jgi:CheY-like chemotaxis protein
MRTLLKQVAESGDKIASSGDHSARRRRLLVIGESLCAAETIEALTGWLDMDVEAAENDRIASIFATISLIEDRPYEAVLIDAETAETNGLEAARWLRCHGWFGPIVACGRESGDGDDNVAKRSLEAGCDTFIGRPLTEESVKAAYAKEVKSDAQTPPAVAEKSESPLHEASAGDVAILKQRGRVLVADDAMCMQAIIGAFLQGLEVDADMAENGQIACDLAMQSLAAGQPYDVILMDIQMPKMTGKQAVKWLRANNWKGPIIAFSSHATEKDHAAFLDAGCTECLAKPLTKETLCGVLSQYVRC